MGQGQDGALSATSWRRRRSVAGGKGAAVADWQGGGETGTLERAARREGVRGQCLDMARKGGTVPAKRRRGLRSKGACVTGIDLRARASGGACAVTGWSGGTAAAVEQREH